MRLQGPQLLASFDKKSWKNICIEVQSVMKYQQVVYLVFLIVNNYFTFSELRLSRRDVYFLSAYYIGGDTEEFCFAGLLEYAPSNLSTW